MYLLYNNPYKQYEISRTYFPYNVFVAFEPEQIKLADGTNTTFDGNNPDIRFESGGEIDRSLARKKQENAKSKERESKKEVKTSKKEKDKGKK